MKQAHQLVDKIQEAVSNVISIEINNLMWGAQCCMNFKGRREPKFIYERVTNKDGDFLVAYDDKTGLVTSFEIKKGTTEGFAGNPFSLSIREEKVAGFVGVSRQIWAGNIWDSAAGKRAADEYFGVKTISIGYRKYPNTLDVYCGVEMDRRVYEAVLSQTGRFK